MDFPDLTRLIEPQSVMVVGASERQGSIGRHILENLLVHSEFAGDLYPVNPRLDSVLGRPCWRSVERVPTAAVDVAVVAVPAAHTLAELHACASRGVRFAVVVTSGFAETSVDGRRMQTEMLALARATGMRIYGPNSPGISNINRRIGLSISPAFKTDRLGGPIALITQGGGLGRTFLQGMERGIGVGLWCSTGNEADLQLSDFVHHVAGAEDIKAVALIVEGVRDGRRFMAAARAASAAGKPIVALKVGRSEYGVRAALSHTASLAGSAEINSAVFRELGVIEVDDLDELVETAALLCRLPPRLGGKVCVYSFSGGTSALAADMVGAAGLELGTFQPDTIAGLKGIAPAYAALDNPVDLTTEVFSRRDLNARCLRQVAADRGIDVVLFPTPADYGVITDQAAVDLVEVQKEAGDKLIVPVWMSDHYGKGYYHLQEHGYPPFRSMGKAVKAIARVVAWSNRPVAGTVELPGAVPPESLAASGVRRGLLSEPDAKSLLATYGVPVPEGRIAHSEEDAVRCTETCGWPAALKIVALGLVHKSDIGGVRLGIRTLAEAGSAYREMIAAVGERHPELLMEGVLVERMVTAPGLELLVGVHRDAVFGLVLSFGLGGLWVETLKDVTHRTLPLSRAEATRMIREIRAWPLLAGARGRPVSDISALETLLLQISDFAVAQGGALEEMDLNPVWIGPTGAGVQVLDAVIRFAK